jgi:tyrosyl-tRNA synthetase
LETTQKLFSNMTASADSFSEQDLESIEGIIMQDYPLMKINASIDVLEMLTETSIFKSKGEAKKMIQNGGLSINRIKITDQQYKVNGSDLLHNKFILIQVGKKTYYLLKGV